MSEEDIPEKRFAKPLRTLTRAAKRLLRRQVTDLQQLARNARRRLSGDRLRGMPTRSKAPFSTHLPVLFGLAQILRPRHVLEFGSGLYSTPVFLDRRVFRDLISLDTYESDPAWLTEVQRLLHCDDRVTIHPIIGGMYNLHELRRLDAYDLIFVDNSMDWRERVKTIDWISDCRPTNSVVLVHDFEFDPYRLAAKRFRHRHVVKALNPATGVLWNSAPITRRKVRKVESVINKGLSLHDVTDIPEWMSLFHNLLSIP